MKNTPIIKINLHDYRDELRKVDIQKRVLKATFVVVASIALIGVSYLMDKAKLETLHSQVNSLNTQVKALEPEVKLVKGMMAKNDRAKHIIAGIQNLRINQLEATRVLGDMGFRVPKDIWLTNFKQMTKADLKSSKVPTIYVDNPAKSKKKGKRGRGRKAKKSRSQEFLQIKGVSFKEKSITAYIQDLEKIPYFKLVFLHKTERTDMGIHPVYEFSIYCYIPKKKTKAVT